MKLIYIAPWPVADPLSLTTVLPHIALLAEDDRVDSITLFSYEKHDYDSKVINELLPQSVTHVPLVDLPRSSIPFLRRIRQYRFFKKKLLIVASSYRPDLIICRATSGILGDFLYRKLSTPYVVESFEPHAHYMLQTATWRWWNPKFLVQRQWEERIKKTAAYLITVSHGYARHLEVSEGIDRNRLRTVPCWVDLDRFRLDADSRHYIRNKLCIGTRIAVVYVGKFYGIYSPLYDLAMLHHLQQGLGEPLYIIVLTSADQSDVRKQLRLSGFRDEQVYVDCVPHNAVNAYLNAADLALSFWSSGPWSFACSPIKHAEYWACGLPLLMPTLVGDEAKWLHNEKAGATALFSDAQSVLIASHWLKTILGEVGHRERIRKIALTKRGPDSLIQVYDELLSVFST